MTNLSERIDLVKAPGNDIYFRCPSQSEAGKTHDVYFRNNGMQVSCDCIGFSMRCAKHHPSELDGQFHCAHVKAAVTFLNESPTIEEMDAENSCNACGAQLEKLPVACGNWGDYSVELCCPRCQGGEC